MAFGNSNIKLLVLSIQSSDSHCLIVILVLSSTNYCRRMKNCGFGQLFNSAMARYGIVCQLLLATLLLPCEAQGCMFGLNTLGSTYPPGDIFLEKGQSLKITCMLDEVDNVTNAKKIFFTAGKERVPKRFVNVIDMSTAELLIPNMTLTNHSVYYCRLQTMDKVVCLNQVVVGLKPQEPKNLTCISENWQSLVCNWDKEDHYLPTSYTILYTLAGQGSRSQLLRCPAGDSDRKNNTCKWDFITSPIYRTVYEFYTIIMTGYNALGNVTFPPIRFHHYAHVIPNPPENLRAQNVTTHSVVLKWVVAYPMQNFPPGLVTRVQYRHQWMPKNKWIAVNTTGLPLKSESDGQTLSITNLYAHTNYIFCVQHKSRVALDSGYSENSTITVKTKSKRPTLSPEVDIGGFEADASLRSIHLYWKSIPQYLHNGDRFEYQIEMVDVNGTSNVVAFTHKTATYTKQHWNVPNSVLNHRAPPKYNIPLSFRGFHKTHFRLDANCRLYYFLVQELKRHRPYPCTGSMNWTRVSVNTNRYNVAVPDDKVYQFAISANGKKVSTGLTWANCIAVIDQRIEEMNHIIIHAVGSNFIEIGWIAGCSHRIGLVQGFVIHYCPINSDTNQQGGCKEASKDQFVAGGADVLVRGMITGLVPNTTYMLHVTVISRRDDGPPSVKKFVTTLP
ncbi:Hypothetical predicted protein [Cloeon dipterum]|uniref:Fibronectin type-III domain-containing protein n=1 Tax=Cloeon dipterum TaxID=197152 RepID=A0A8S1C777_9INSE|nr:Hypothetical predicted protein [Cloeon dipterum]